MTGALARPPERTASPPAFHCRIGFDSLPRPLAFAGAALFALGFILKARVEERFLAGELPDYAEYRERVRMIVPFVI